MNAAPSDKDVFIVFKAIHSDYITHDALPAGTSVVSAACLLQPVLFFTCHNFYIILRNNTTYTFP